MTHTLYPRRSTRRRIADRFMIGVLIVVIIATFFAWMGWMLMLLLGVLWHEFGWLKPLGFWTSAGLAFLIAAVSGIVRNSSSSGKS